MNVKQLLAVGAIAAGFTSCGLLGNTLSGGPLFSGTVGGTAPTASSYKLALVQFTAFGDNGSSTFQAAAFGTTIRINGGTGVYNGALVPSIDLGNDNQRFYKIAVYDDRDNNDIYNTVATAPDNTKDTILADSINNKADGGNRFFVYAKADGTWTAGQPLKAGWNLVTDVQKNSSLLGDVNRSDDLVTQAGGFGGITINY
jgi:hypothetical protein